VSVVYQIESDGFLYEVVDDLAILYQAVFTGALLDETNGEPIVSLPVLSTDLEKLSLRSATGALIAGAAYVEQVFPKLATTSYLFHVDISAEGYQHTTLTVNVPAGTTFPITTAPVIMRRIPVRLQGKVVKDSDRSPLPLATVSSKSGKTPLLRDNVRSSHAAGTTVRSFSFTNLGAARKLSATALPGSTGVVLDNNAGLGANDFLQIGSDGSAQIYQVSGTGPAAGLVVLQSPLTATFPDGTAVQQLNPVGPSGNSTLARSSDPGDGLLVLATALSDSGIEIVDGAATEYHWLNAVSGTDGYYQADGIVAVAALELLCKSGVLTPGDQPWMPQYGDRVNVVDFRLRP
jgi:hypothetical protein